MEIVVEVGNAIAWSSRVEHEVRVDTVNVNMPWEYQPTPVLYTPEYITNLFGSHIHIFRPTL